MGCTESKEAPSNGAKPARPPPPDEKAPPANAGLTRDQRLEHAVAEGQEMFAEAELHRNQVLCLRDAEGLLLRARATCPTECGTEYAPTDCPSEGASSRGPGVAPPSAMTVNDLSVALPLDPTSCVMFLPHDFLEGASDGEVVAEGWAIKSSSGKPLQSPESDRPLRVVH